MQTSCLVGLVSRRARATNFFARAEKNLTNFWRGERDGWMVWLGSHLEGRKVLSAFISHVLDSQEESEWVDEGVVLYDEINFSTLSFGVKWCHTNNMDIRTNE